MLNKYLDWVAEQHFLVGMIVIIVSVYAIVAAIAGTVQIVGGLLGR